MSIRSRWGGITILALIAALLAACDDAGVDLNFGDEDRIRGNGNVTVDTRDVGTFDRLTLAGEGTVIATIGSEPALTIEAEDNLTRYITSQVSAGSLEIRTEPGIDLDPTEPIVYRITAPDLRALAIAGAGEIRIEQLEAPDLELAVSGAGTIELAELDVGNLTVEITGAGRIEVAGEADSQRVMIPGVGTYDAADLETERATIVSTGVGSATVWVTERLDATTSGVGGISYYGSPEVHEDVSGVGAVNPLGDK